MQLRTVATSLFVEVWDGSDDAPVMKDPDISAEGGRGLVLISTLTKQWDVYRPAVGGEVVWAELGLSEPAEPPSIYAQPLEIRVPGCTHPPRGRTEETAHLALIERMLDGTEQEDELREG
ncbi:ATP-binding protein [Streptomyces sp. NPDC002845]